MKDEYLKLKEYLTKEYIKMSEEQDDLITKIIELEIEREEQENPLFANKGIENIRRMFSPLPDDVLQISNKEIKKSKLVEEIEKLENNVDDITVSMEEMKKYISLVKSMERQWIEEEISTLPSEKNQEGKYKEYNGNDVEDDARAMIVAAIQFIESEYPHINFYKDIEEDNYILSSEANSNLIRIVTYTISSTIESMAVDSVWIEMKRKNNDMIISLQLVNDGGLIGHYAYKTSLTIV